MLQIIGFREYMRGHTDISLIMQRQRDDLILMMEVMGVEPECQFAQDKELTSKMTGAQISEAMRRAREWFKSHDPELSVMHRYLSILLLCKLSVLKYKAHVMPLLPVMMNCCKDWHYRRI